MVSLLFIVLLVAALAAIGRHITPRRERLPVLRWSASDLASNTVGGARFLLTCSHRLESLLTDSRLPRRPRPDGNPAGCS